MQTNTTQHVPQVTEYMQLAPLMESMLSRNDQQPKNMLPKDSLGTIQQNHQVSIPNVTLYNAHGILTKTGANTLLGYA